MSNKKLLKNLLATASMVAVLAGGASNAAATAQTFTLTANAETDDSIKNGAEFYVNGFNLTIKTQNLSGVKVRSESDDAFGLTSNIFVETSTAFDEVIFKAPGKGPIRFAIHPNQTGRFGGDLRGLGHVTLANGASFVLDGGVNLVDTATVDALNGGSYAAITFSGTSEVNSIIGGVIGLNTITFNGDDKSNVTFSANATSTTFKIANAGTVTVADNTVLTGNLIGAGGKLVLAGANSQVTGAVGKSGEQLASVDVAGDAGDMGALYTNALNFKGGDAAIQIEGGKIDAITTDTDGKGSLILVDATTLGSVGKKDKRIQRLHLANNAAYKITEDVYATDMTVDNNNTTLILSNGVVLNSNLLPTAPFNGKIIISSKSENTVKGNIGSPAGAFGVIQFQSAGTLNVDGNVHVGGLALNAGSTSTALLNFTSEDNTTLEVSQISNVKNLTIKSASSGTFQIISHAHLGDANNNIALISAPKADLKFDNDTYTVNVNAVDAKSLSLNGSYMFKYLPSGIKINLDGDAGFVKGTNLQGLGSIALNGKALVFTDVNLVGGLVDASNGGGVLVFIGTSVYNSTQNGMLTEVQVMDNAKFTLASNIESDQFVINASATATIKAKLRSPSVEGENNTSILQLSEGSSVVGDVNMKAGSVVVDKSVSTKIDGNLDNAIVTLGGAGASLEVTGTTYNSVQFLTLGDNTDSVVLSSDYTPTETIGAVGKKLKSITLTGDNTLTIANGKNAYVTSLLNSKDGEGKVVFGTGRAPIYNIGTEKSKFASVTLGDHSVIKGNIYSNELVRGINTIAIEDGKSVIVTDSIGTGTIMFAGNGTFAGTFGASGANVDLFVLSDDAKYVVSGQGSVYANEVIHSKGALQLTGDLSFLGGHATFVDGSSINTAEHVLSYEDSVLDANNTTNVSVTLTDDKTGNVNFGSSHVDPNTKVALTVVDNRSLKAIAKDTSATVITMEAADVHLAKSIVDNVLDKTIVAGSGNRFVAISNKLTTSIDDTFVVTAGVDSEVSVNASDDMKRFGAKGGALKLAQAIDANLSNNYALLDSVSLVSDQDYVNAFERLSDASTAVSSAGMNAMTSGMNQISTRSSAVAAGDAGIQIGAWVEGLVGKDTQKTRKSEAGFKSKTSGVTVGIDTELNDAAIVGIAGTFANTDVKMKDYLNGDKSKVSSYMVSLYGSYNFADNYVLQGSGSFGNSTIKNTNKRIMNSGTVNAKSKFNGTAFGAKALVGYKYNIGDMGAIMPMTGLEYARFDAGNATETGAGVQNRSIKVKATDKLTGILGAKVTSKMDLGDYSVTPEMHVFGGYDFKGTKAKSSIKFADTTTNIGLSAAKAARTSFNVGGSITAKYDNMEYGVGYDAKISEKYFGQQGSLKVRVNF